MVAFSLQKNYCEEIIPMFYRTVKTFSSDPVQQVLTKKLEDIEREIANNISSMSESKLGEVMKERKRLRSELEKTENKNMMAEIKLESLRKANSQNEIIYERFFPKYILYTLTTKGKYTVYVRKNSFTKEFEAMFTAEDLGTIKRANALANTIAHNEEWEDDLTEAVGGYIPPPVAPGGHREKKEFMFIKEALTYFCLHPRLILRENKLPNFSNKRDEECLVCFPLDVLTPGEYPKLKQFLDRMDYPDHFMAWVGSIFLAESTNSQVMWLQGEGNDGKSVIMNKITDLLKAKKSENPICTSVNETALDSPFAYSGLSHCRLVTIADTKYLSLISTPFVHKLTGGDLVASEEKYEAKVQERIFCKIFVTSNYSPAIEKDATNEIRRLLRIKVKGRGTREKDKRWEADIEKEIPHFVYDCLSKYHEISSNDVIEPDDEAYLADAGSFVEDIFEDICDKKLTFGEGYYATVLDVAKLLSKASKEFSTDKIKFANSRFTRFLKNRYGVELTEYPREDKKKIRLYAGMKTSVNFDLKEWQNEKLVKASLVKEEEVIL